MQHIKATNSRSKIEFAELIKLINKRKISEIRNYTVKEIDEAMKKKTERHNRKLCLEIYTLKDSRAMLSEVSGT